jgi:glycosyltransferase EpsD
MSEKRILFTSHTANFSKYNLPFIKLLQKNGYKVDYASAMEEKIPAKLNREFKIDFVRSPFRLDKHIKAYRQLRKVLTENHYDLIHTHTPVGSVITRLAARATRKKGTKVIYTAHGFHFFRGAPLLNWLLWYPTEKICARFTDTLITMNREDYKRANKHFKTHTVYIPGVGIDPNKYGIKMTAKQRNDYRQTLGLKPDDFVIIYVAEISKRKNQARLLKEKAETIKKNPRTHIILAGHDILNGKIQKLAHKLGIADNVHILGYRRDVPQLFKISDLYCTTSRQEGLNTTIIEARLGGLPVEATRVRGHEPAFAKDISQFYLDNILKEMKKIYGLGNK